MTGRHHVEHVMGMAVSIDVRDPVPAAAVDEVVAWLHAVDATYSTHRPESAISRFGRGELPLADLDPEVVEVLALCEDLRADTDGAFDIWVVPTPDGTRFDPSGLVKGWAVERAARLLESHGARDLCINAGGDVAVRGEAGPGRPWRVGVRHPGDERALARVLAVRGRTAVATSGTYERGAHIVDPRTGEPTAELASVTVVGPDLTFADAYATAVFVMGLDGLAWLQERHPDHHGMAITHDGDVWSTPGFAALDPPTAA